MLSWLLGEVSAEPVRRALSDAEIVLASDLTLIECDRALIRAVATGRLSESHAFDRRAHVNRVAAHWVLLGIDSQIVERARRPFPGEPIRTLDALHLSSALMARSALPETALLSLDDRVRASGRDLGFSLLPS